MVGVGLEGTPSVQDPPEKQADQVQGGEGDQGETAYQADRNVRVRRMDGQADDQESENESQHLTSGISHKGLIPFLVGSQDVMV